MNMRLSSFKSKRASNKSHDHNEEGQRLVEEDQDQDQDQSQVQIGQNSQELDNINPLLPEDDLLIEQLKNELEIEFNGTSRYERQSRVINRAIQDMGMGRYQWELFILCGFGWFADNLWLQGLALSLPSLSSEFGLSENNVRYTTMILYIGMGFGSVVWGLLSDTFGRRIAFNCTLFLTGLFGTLISLGPTWPVTSLLFALMGFGVGGNLPVDGALFLEFLPAADNRLLTLLSAWWPLGQVASAMIAWYVIPNYSCAENSLPCSMVSKNELCCLSKNNRGWRYLMAVLGSFTLFMFICRFYIFKLYESPKFLLSKNKSSQAIQVVQQLAHYNGTKTWLDEYTLRQLAGEQLSTSGLLVKTDSGNVLSITRLRSLFSTWKLGITTVLLWIIWLTVGMAFPLFNAFLLQYLQHSDNDPVPTDIVYRNYVITSLAGVPGSFIACYTVDLPRFGRKGTMAISTIITGTSLFLFIISTNPTWQTFSAALQSFFSNVMYGVIYAFTPEVFPAPVRGTGSGVASLLNRLAGISAPIIAANSGKYGRNSPIIGAGSLYFVASIAMFLLPIETRGQQSL